MYSYCAKADISIGQAAVPFPETSVSDSVAKVTLDIFGEKVMSCSRLTVIGGSLSGLLLMAALYVARAEAQPPLGPSTDRKRAVSGTSVSVRVALGASRLIKKKQRKQQ